MSEFEPWERQETETARAFEAFAVYRDLPPQRRSLREVARRMDRGDGQLNEWSKAHDWVERTEAWDRVVDEAKRRVQLRQAEAAVAVHNGISTQMLGIVRQGLNTIDASKLTARELVRMFDVAVKIQRQALGITQPEPETETNAEAELPTFADVIQLKPGETETDIARQISDLLPPPQVEAG